jgi:hypothetical protein
MWFLAIWISSFEKVLISSVGILFFVWWENHQRQLCANWYIRDRGQGLVGLEMSSMKTT